MRRLAPGSFLRRSGLDIHERNGKEPTAYTRPATNPQATTPLQPNLSEPHPIAFQERDRSEESDA